MKPTEPTTTTAQPSEAVLTAAVAPGLYRPVRTGPYVDLVQAGRVLADAGLTVRVRSARRGWYHGPQRPGLRPAWWDESDRPRWEAYLAVNGIPA